MSHLVEVWLGESATRVGTLRYDARGNRESSAFEYAATWLKDGYALSPGLPLVRGLQFHKSAGRGSVFHDPIADTEPDGWGKKVILRDHAKRRNEARTSGVTSPALLTSLDILLGVDDVSRVGALRFRDQNGQFARVATHRRAPPLIELSSLLAASRAVELNQETKADLAYLLGRGTSLGGLRPKCSVIDADGTLAIGKFPSVQDERAVTKAEVLALQLARRCGINAADARIVLADNIPVAVIRRFDRVADGRLMYISAASMLGVDSTDDGEHSYTEIVDAIRRYGAAPQVDIEELWRRVAFSIAINNVDDHLLNHGFLHADRGLWRLSPAFDLNPFPDRAPELKTWISEDAGPDASIDALLAVAPYFRISKSRAAEIRQQVDDVVASWRVAGEAIGMTTSELDAFADAFEMQRR